MLAARGLLTDLYPLLDADKELKRSDFFPNVLAALECSGGLYQAVSGFTVNTLSGQKELVGSSQGWTYDDFFTALNQMPEGSSILEQYVVQSDVLTTLLSLNYDRFVDWEKGESDFESDEFKQLLSFVNCFPQYYDWDSTSDEEEVLSTADRVHLRKQMLLQSFLYSPDALIWSDIDLRSDELTYVGWPVGEGVGSMLRMDSGYAISSTCRNPDAAWEFLRTLLTEEGQQSTGSLPTNRGVYDAQVRNLMTEDYERDANGEPILDAEGQPLRKYIVTWYDDDSVEHHIYSMTQEQADRALSVIENCTRMANYDDAVFGIVSEEAGYYFSGTRSVDDVARLIQSRVASYMSEQLPQN
jgi:ABC-type glycerol-3-phosphate transport system substrate-binding protein